MPYRLVRVQADQIEKDYGTYDTLKKAKNRDGWGWREYSSFWGYSYWASKPNQNGQFYRIYYVK